MTLMTGFRPLREFTTLREAVDRLFEDTYGGPGWYSLAGNGRFMPIDLYETPEEFVLRAHVPGVDPADVEVNYQQGVLSIRANSKAVDTADGARWHVREIGAGEVTRQIALPREIDVDRATANFENGLLTLTLPKTANAKPRRIQIGPAGEANGQHQITANSEG